MARAPRSRPRPKPKPRGRRYYEVDYGRPPSQPTLPGSSGQLPVARGGSSMVPRDGFYGGAASNGSRSNLPQRYSKVNNTASGSSSYENWKRQQKRGRNKHLRNHRSSYRSSYRRGGKRFRWGRLFSMLSLAVFIIFLGAFMFSSGFRDSVVSGVYTFAYNRTHEDPKLAGDNEGKEQDAAHEIVYTSVEMKKSDIDNGDLILVNNDYDYDFEANAESIHLVGINEYKCNAYSAMNNDLQVGSVMINALNKMFTDFYNTTGNDSVCVISAYRTLEYQENLYKNKVSDVGQAKADEWAALPGFSEHHTGLAVDIGISAPGGGAETFRRDGDYAWVVENCYKYGLVNRYDESKRDITGIMDEPWHYRYVGIPHAQVMYTENLCLEEYIESLKYYSYNGDHLKVAADNGKDYEIYYVTGKFRSGVPVPKNYEYTISGNNVDGFVVTVDMSTYAGSEDGQKE